MISKDYGTVTQSLIEKADDILPPEDFERYFPLAPLSLKIHAYAVILNMAVSNVVCKACVSLAWKLIEHGWYKVAVVINNFGGKRLFKATVRRLKIAKKIRDLGEEYGVCEEEAMS